MSAKSLKYAEEYLGVHVVFEEAKVLLEALDETLRDLDKAQDERRKLVEDIADREADVLSDEWGKHSDMAVGRMEQHIKVARRRDDLLKALRDRLNIVLATIQGCEYDMDITKVRLRVATARLEELGGYLHYLAAIKQAEKTTTQTKGPTT